MVEQSQTALVGKIKHVLLSTEAQNQTTDEQENHFKYYDR